MRIFSSYSTVLILKIKENFPWNIFVEHQKAIAVWALLREFWKNVIDVYHYGVHNYPTSPFRHPLNTLFSVFYLSTWFTWTMLSVVITRFWWVLSSSWAILSLSCFWSQVRHLKELNVYELIGEPFFLCFKRATGILYVSSVWLQRLLKT